ncbi:ABC transporter substrate-binding protein [Micromonospora chaiyaphumensis]|uniref:Amino acid/amide ABC transporter substrate-binding protein, HAAT family (TC 3.A.1.4.-) n=1 Tax=Micromonospora chaiyaphumensis TaxID=307119 RepID=A0A1C4VE97_9ACTN|nr:ABC transporter substrate-binding protein [Micromonospora chaiyaphumensis]SCE82161.1 amino acid/amide ABC transporter substrate-binding protein, HAAT family (TC 3.A.1.4.-) [Micromonospora chaiyaphumensis]
MATPAIDSSVLTRRGVLAAAAASLLLAGCGQPGERPDDDSSASSAPGNQDLVVGASLELTGRGAALGVPQQRALEITAEALNGVGIPVGNLRRSVRLEIRDNRSNPGEAARQAAELTRAGAQALIGGTLAETSVALAKAAQKVKTPFLSLGLGDGVVLPLAERTFSFQVTPDAIDVARRLADLIGAQRVRQVALLAADGLHGDSGVRAVRTALHGTDVDLVRTVRLPATGRSFAGAARRIAAVEPDGVIVWGAAPDSGVAARELRRADYDGPIFFDAGAVTADTLSAANAAAVEGAYAVHPAGLGASALTATSTADLERRNFNDRYAQRYGRSDTFAPYASDALQLVAESVRLATSLDRGRLRAFLQTQVAEGIAGGYAFTETRHGGMEPDSLAAYVVAQGSWQLYG